MYPNLERLALCAILKRTCREREAIFGVKWFPWGIIKPELGVWLKPNRAGERWTTTIVSLLSVNVFAVKQERDTLYYHRTGGLCPSTTSILLFTRDEDFPPPPSTSITHVESKGYHACPKLSPIDTCRNRAQWSSSQFVCKRNGEAVVTVSVWCGSLICVPCSWLLWERVNQQ